MITANEVNVSSIEIDGGGGFYGFYLDNVEYSNLFNIIGSNKHFFVYLFQSSNCIIKNNEISNAGGIGLVSSNYNTIYGNIIENPRNYGIMLTESNENQVFENFISNGNFFAIHISNSNNNKILNNTYCH